jgi:superfamily II DNA/RNA helicase
MWQKSRFTHGKQFGGKSSGRSFNRPKGRAESTIHPSKFIKKAVLSEAEEIFIPKISFADLPIDARLKNNIIKKGYKDPTPIQDGTILPLLEGKDVIGIANTGTGKTAAFLIPLIEKILKNDKEDSLIIVPTRELAQQIQQELRSFTYGLPVYSSLCIGGTSIRNQIYELKRNPHIVIGTPGRLKDLIERNVLRMSFFHSIVLDEVDRMVDMGFIKDIKYLISLLPEQRQSLFFSATVSPDIKGIIESFLKDPVRVSVASSVTSDNVDQDIVRVEAGAYKVDILEKLLKKEEFDKVLIFARTKYRVDDLANAMFKKGFKVSSIHGDKPQNKRQQAIRFFKEGVVDILIATDVAARGIDIPNITHVINYDQPATYEDYIHRIGRTGRSNQKGHALTFV